MTKLPSDLPLPDSEDQVRNLKASESVSAAFQGQGMAAPPPGIADIIAAHVKSETKSITLKDIKNMAPGSGGLGVSAASGVNLFLSMLSPAQRDAAKAGVNPLDPAAVHRFEIMLRGGAGLQSAGLSGGIGNSSGRFAEMKEAGVRSGVSASLIDDYTKQYNGMGFSNSAIGTFASVQLGARDFLALEKQWGRSEALRGAETARDFGFKGREAVGDVTGISKDEKGLWSEYKQAKTPQERETIRGKIHALPPRKNEDKKESDERRQKIEKIFEDANQANLKVPSKVLTATERASTTDDRKTDTAALFEAMKKQRAAQLAKQP
ncbi:MAG: hypothetical protein WDN48_02360 [Pseudolabrys sp.]